MSVIRYDIEVVVNILYRSRTIRIQFGFKKKVYIYALHLSVMANVHCVIRCTVNANKILCLINPILIDTII